MKNPIRAWAVSIVQQAIQEDRDEQARQAEEIREAISKPWAPEYADWYIESLKEIIPSPTSGHARGKK